MPLTATTKRTLAHTRIITCKGYEREDGLWDIEGTIVDTKPFAFPNKDRGGEIQIDEPLHNISLRITIDSSLNIHDADAILDDTPFDYCKSIHPVIQQLIGLKIGAGWTRKIKEAMGDKKGCTHLTELLGPVATTAYQTLFDARKGYAGATSENQNNTPDFLNKCHALMLKSPVVLENWPQFYQQESCQKDA